LDQQALAFSGRIRAGVSLESHVISQGAAKENVVPGANVQGVTGYLKKCSSMTTVSQYAS